MIENPDWPQTRIAEEVGVNYNYVSKCKLKEPFKEELQKALKTAWQGYANKAQHTMLSLLDSPKDEVKFKAAQYILDSCGYKATEKIEISQDTITVTIEGQEENGTETKP